MKRTIHPPIKLEDLRPHFEAYGCKLGPGGDIITKRGTGSGLVIQQSGARIQIRSEASDALVFSGSPTAKSVASFLESFWYLKPLEVNL